MPLLACSVVEYAVPVVPPGNDVVVIVGAAVLLPSRYSALSSAVLFAASVTFTVNDEVPAVVGVPEIAPWMRLGSILQATCPHSDSTCRASCRCSLAAWLNMLCRWCRRAMTSW